MSRLREQHLSLAMRSEVRSILFHFTVSRLFVTPKRKAHHSFLYFHARTQEMKIRKDASKTMESFEAELQEELDGMMQSLQDERNEKMRAAAAFKRQGSHLSIIIPFGPFSINELALPCVHKMPVCRGEAQTVFP